LKLKFGAAYYTFADTAAFPQTGQVGYLYKDASTNVLYECVGDGTQYDSLGTAVYVFETTAAAEAAIDDIPDGAIVLIREGGSLGGGGGGATVEIIDDLTHTDTDKALSANQGKVLKDYIDSAYQDLLDRINGEVI
jgi:hypothetical protein